eukprot:Sspe_Gene.1556::Locus_515_Transcript_1_1_Confidence_1.000_Length_1391::g.1556::m.1556/K00297/metF, MTHFR; methylenetetrahydrofolate reductase (NADPH)
MSGPVPHLVKDVLTVDRTSKYDNDKKVAWSFEFFPPKTDAGVKNLDARLGRMRGMHPEFIDFTWGAGGSTSDLTMELCRNAQEKHNYIANMHLTCTNMEKGKVQEALEQAKKHHIPTSSPSVVTPLRGRPSGRLWTLGSPVLLTW